MTALPAATAGILEGIRVCDFTWVGAGPIATSLLAQLGADVIKVESATRPDVLRLTGPFKGGRCEGLERSGYFASRNPNKRSIALNMSRPEARRVALDLIGSSDILINNFRVGQMEKWGLGWDDVRPINPRLIYVTMNLQGSTGPHSGYMGFGVNLNALCGLTYRCGFPGAAPFGTGTHYTDHVMVPTHALFGIFAALIHREVTGEGQTVEISQLEAAVCMKPSDAMAWAAHREVLGPLGFGDPQAAPHGVFATEPWEPSGRSAEIAPGKRCYPRWLAVAVFSEEQWAAFKRVMGSPTWAESEKFAHLDGRKKNEAELNASVEAWTRGPCPDSEEPDGCTAGEHEQGPRRDPSDRARELSERLASEGVSAGPVNDAQDVVRDEHLRARRFWHVLEHPEMGPTLYNRGPIVFSETPLEMRSAAPLLGQHTREVLTGLLGYTIEEVDDLVRRGVLV